MRKADNLPPSYAIVTKSGNLNFLEPSGPLRACNGTALPLPSGLRDCGHSTFIILVNAAVSDKTVYYSWRGEGLWIWLQHRDNRLWRSYATCDIKTIYSRISFCDGSFTTIHFYDSCRVGPSTAELWCITVATHRVSFCDGPIYDDSLLFTTLVESDRHKFKGVFTHKFLL